MSRRGLLVIFGLLLGAITTMVVMAYLRLDATVEGVNHVRSKGDIQSMGKELKAYQAMNGSLPTTEQGLHALVEEPTGSPRPAHWRKLFEGVPQDPWNTTYVYRCPGMRHPDHYDLFSAGPDRKPDTADDVWVE